jgi:hypothetical protein
MLADCVFGSLAIKAGTDLNDPGLMGPLAAPPDAWPCLPSSLADAGGLTAPCACPRRRTR